jgi:hypothetical protein
LARNKSDSCPTSTRCIPIVVAGSFTLHVLISLIALIVSSARYSSSMHCVSNSEQQDSLSIHKTGLEATQ